MTDATLLLLFAPHGATYAKILNQLDDYGRRRGFVDMVSPLAAMQAIANLEGKLIDGYVVEVTYAIVQRSGGFRPSIVPASAPPRRLAVLPTPRSEAGLMSSNPPLLQRSTIAVSHLPPSFTIRQLVSVMSQYGQVVHARLSDGTGFVVFENEPEAEQAIRDLRGQWCQGAQLDAYNWGKRVLEQVKLLPTRSSGATHSLCRFTVFYASDLDRPSEWFHPYFFSIASGQL